VGLILHLDVGDGFRGGQRQLLLLAVAQRAAGESVQVVCASPALHDRLREAGVPTERIALRGAAALGGARQVARWTRRAQLVHAHDARAHGLVVALSPAATPVVVHRRIDNAPHSRPITRWKYRRGLLLCVSSAVREVLRSFGIPDERLRVVRSGVPLPAPIPRSPREAGAPLRAVALGALVPHKGHADLLEALRALERPCTLDVLGDGPLRGELREAAPMCGRVSFLGDPAGRPPRWERYDVLVHPSRTEGLGTAVLDAQAAGVPVVATAAGGLPEAVAPSGWLVPPRDPRALVAALTAVGELAPAELVRRGRDARAWVAARFSIERMHAEVAAAYREVLSNP
jgi:glycosyltransferase involved in cell wall biosynthesis